MKGKTRCWKTWGHHLSSGGGWLPSHKSVVSPCSPHPHVCSIIHLRSQIQRPSVSQRNRENYLSPYDLKFAQSNLCIRPIHRKVATLFEQFFCHWQVISLLPLGRQISFQEMLQSVVLDSPLSAVGCGKLWLQVRSGTTQTPPTAPSALDDFSK